MIQNFMHSISFTLDDAKEGRGDAIALSAIQCELPQFTRSQLHHHIKQGTFLFEGVPITKRSFHAAAGTYTLLFAPPELSTMTPVPMNLDIVYEDGDLAIINKPAGLSVHSGAGNHHHTLVHGLLYQLTNLSGIGGVLRPGVVHRLDKDTSGLMVIAKHDDAHRHLSAQFGDRTLSRTYIAFVRGYLSPYNGEIETLIRRHNYHRQHMEAIPLPEDEDYAGRGKYALTRYATQQCYVHKSAPHHRVSKVVCTLKTGRTHQIRVHMKYKGCPVLGDSVYTSVKKITPLWGDVVRQFSRQALHAQALSFIHPRTGDRVDFECPLPQDMQDLEHALNAHSIAQ